MITWSLRLSSTIFRFACPSFSSPSIVGQGESSTSAPSAENACSRLRTCPCVSSRCICSDCLSSGSFACSSSCGSIERIVFSILSAAPSLNRNRSRGVSILPPSSGIFDPFRLLADTLRLPGAGRLKRLRGESIRRLRSARSQWPALHGGERMNDNARWRAVRLEDLERRGRFIPVRENLGIHSFGINAIKQGDDGTLINEHDEEGGQEEVYVVLDGTATFEIDGETLEAPAGTFVSVEPEARRKATGDATVLALGGTVGEAYQAMDWGEAWPIQDESMAAYGGQRYAEAAVAVRRGLEQFPDHAGLNYNYACFATLSGEVDDETFAHLRKGVEGFPPFREQARADEDLAAVRDDPRFEEALR